MPMLHPNSTKQKNNLPCKKKHKTFLILSALTNFVSLRSHYEILQYTMRNTFILLLICLATLCHGQSYKIFTADQGLSSSLINKIHQDRNGMIWIATEDGLNRYDGVKLTIYRHQPENEHSLANNYVRTLFEDNQGHLIIGTYVGLQMYDPATDTFSPLAKHKNGEIFKSHITNIIQRKNGEVWASGNTMCKLIISNQKLFVEDLTLPIPTISVDNIMEDKSGNIWIAREEDGLYRMDTQKQVTHYPITEKIPFISVLCEDMQGNIYGGSTQNGVFKFDRTTDQFIPLLNNEQQNFPVKVLYPVNQDELYIGCDGNGLKIFNNKTRQLSDYQFEEGIFASRTSKVHSVLKDQSGNYWVAIYQKGVIMIPSLKNGFKYWGCKSVSKNIIGTNCVTALYKDNSGTTYVGTDSDGLYIIDKNDKQQAHFTHSNDPQSVPSIIIALYEDSEHNLWIGSYANGAARIDKKTGKCTYLQDLVDKSGKNVRNVYAFVEDNQKRLWIATMGGGLFYYDLATHKVNHISNLSTNLGEYWICSLYYSTKKDCLYIGTYNGLCRIDLGKADMPCQYALQQCIIYSIYEHTDGNIWAGTSNGLLKWDEQSNETHIYTTNDGLTNNSAYAISGDAMDYLWISTSNGISRFHPITQKFTNYYVNDGLQGNEFSKNASWRDKQGIIWFGGVNGITYFNPLEIIATNKKWHVRITDFYLFNKPVKQGTMSGGKNIINCPVFEAQTFRLAHQDNSFGIEFSTLELDNTDRVIYAYSMNNNPWTALPRGTNRVSFSNLSPGTYHFALKAKDGIIESDIKDITIYIAQPWWNSGWAWIFYVLATLGIAFFIALQIRHRYLAKQEMARHIRTEQLNEAKLQYFINISHEIRTPMSLIISPLQQLMTSDPDSKRQKIYRTIHRNAERILRLVNQLMDIRKIDKGQMQLTFCETDAVKFIADLYNTFADLAEKKHITFTFHHDNLDKLSLWVDTANFDKIILNILSNAFKFTPEGGMIDITLRTENYPEAKAPLNQCAEIIITDSGVGINPSELERIFDRFYQVHNTQSNNYQGTGIGLHLTRLLVQLHHGIIHAENAPDGISGSRFIIRLPLGNAHLHPEEMEIYTPQSPTIQPGGPISTMTDLQSEKDASSPVSRPRMRRRILLVEDDEEIRLYLKQELVHEYYITESSNGKEALDTIFTQTPDLIISDIMMPEMDGLTLCRKIKQNINLNHIPIILLTAKAREEDNIEGLDTGADAYISKPFNIEILRHTIRNLIRNREQLRNIYSTSQQTGEKKMEKIEAQSPDDRLMERIMKVINAHIGNPDLTVELIASEVGMSRVHLHRKLKELTNQTTRDFIRNIRMKQAATLLSEKRHAISEVANLVGYTNMGNFSTAFKELYGMSPSTYREQHTAQTN